MQDVSALATGLTLSADGIWRSAVSSRVDYPDEANAFCFAVEDSSFWFKHRNAVIVSVVRRFPPAGFIADIGAGNGYVSLGLARAGFETLVLEPGPHGIRNAQSRGLRPLVCATLQDAAFVAGSLPAAAMFDVLEHIEDDVSVLELLHTLLVPGGRFYCSVPAFQRLWSSEDDLVGHYRRYTIGGLSTRLADAGFAVEFGTYMFAPLPLPILLLRSLPTLLGWRRTLEADRAAAELRPQRTLAVRALERVLDAERAVIERGRRIPIGSSCLVIARRR